MQKWKMLCYLDLKNNLWLLSNNLIDLDTTIQLSKNNYVISQKWEEWTIISRENQQEVILSSEETE